MLVDVASHPEDERKLADGQAKRSAPEHRCGENRPEAVGKSAEQCYPRPRLLLLGASHSTIACRFFLLVRQQEPQGQEV